MFRRYFRRYILSRFIPLECGRRANWTSKALEINEASAEIHVVDTCEKSEKAAGLVLSRAACLIFPVTLVITRKLLRESQSLSKSLYIKNLDINSQFSKFRFSLFSHSLRYPPNLKSFSGSLIFKLQIFNFQRSLASNRAPPRKKWQSRSSGKEKRNKGENFSSATPLSNSLLWESTNGVKFYEAVRNVFFE